eukprot:m.175650 g.175650  ORF g.175650 m.175650 type:complete len:99 (+) comp16786_c0_seq5:467-763(+)
MLGSVVEVCAAAGCGVFTSTLSISSDVGFLLLLLETVSRSSGTLYSILTVELKISEYLERELITDCSTGMFKSSQRYSMATQPINCTTGFQPSWKNLP